MLAYTNLGAVLYGGMSALISRGNRLGFGNDALLKQQTGDTMMKKSLIGTTALVAATAFAGTAMAAEPLQLSLGGFASVFAGYAKQDDDYVKTLNSGAGAEVSDFDIKGDNEIHFKAKSMLDNGLTVGVKIEMEAGGKGNRTAVDEYQISLGGSFGTIIAGADDNALVAVANRSPLMGGRLFGAGLNDGDLAEGDTWILKPAGATGVKATYIDTNGDREAISYISPSFGGLMLAASYIPDARSDHGESNAAQPNGSNTQDAYALGLAYSGKMNHLMINADIGALVGDDSDVDEHKEYQAGLHISYGGLMFGGGYRMIKRDKSSATAPNKELDADSWEAGVGYKHGPYGIAIGYVQTTTDIYENPTTKSENESSVIQLTSEYEIGPGVLLAGGLGYASYEDGNVTGAAGENSGWVATTGLSLSF